MTINKAILLGNLGNEPELRASPGKKSVCVFNLATDAQRVTTEPTPPQWHRIVCFGTLAENCAKYLKKGREVYVEGQIQTRRWSDNEGKERLSNQIIAQTVQFIGGRKEEQISSPSTEIEYLQEPDEEFFI